jgi:transcription elongation factor Elf1
MFFIHYGMDKMTLMWWAVRMMFECPHCGNIQSEDGSQFYAPVTQQTTKENMKCDVCKHLSVFPMSGKFPEGWKQVK